MVGTSLKLPEIPEMAKAASCEQMKPGSTPKEDLSAGINQIICTDTKGPHQFLALENLSCTNSESSWRALMQNNSGV